MSYNPSPIPLWVRPVSYAVGVIVLGTLTYRLSQREVWVTLEEQREMQIIVGSLLSVVGGTMLTLSVFDAGPAVAVSAGAVGYLIVLGLQIERVESVVTEVLPCPYVRRAWGWGVLKAVSWVGYATVGIESRLGLAFGLVIVIATALFIYDLGSKHGDIPQDLTRA